MDDFLSTRNLPGIVAMGITPSGTFYEGVFGTINTATGEPLQLDSPHAIMSMTKPLTSLAILRLMEAAKLDLEDPVENFLPAWKDVQRLQNVNVQEKTYNRADLKKKITIRHLLTHTAGLGYAFCNETLYALRPESEQALFPLLHEPGAAWTYSVSTRVLGEVISAVTGQGLFDALKELIFDPLGMTSTDFEPRAGQAHTHVMRDNAWQPNDLMPRMEFGDGGLISTAPDYAKFLSCLLNDGAPLISAETFRQAVSNQIGDLYVMEQPAANPALTHPFPTGGGTDKFGFGFQVHLGSEPGMRSPGSYSWCGLLNTYFWGDPVKKVGGILLMQVLPLYEPLCLETLRGFENRLYKMMEA